MKISSGYKGFLGPMFEGLTGKLSNVFDRLRGRGSLTEADVTEALREVRIALLEADVALPVVRDFIAAVKDRAVGADVLRSVTPGQMVVKIVHDVLVETLGAESVPLSLAAVPPVAILMVGLQGSGKTTSTAKLARRLTETDRRKVLMASLDTSRPAAQEQLAILGDQIGVATLPIIPGQTPLEIAGRAMTAAKLEGYDVLLLDTAGRLAIDDALMAEVAAVRDLTQPHETLLVVDAMTGQDALTVATSFRDRVGLSGIILTRMDGDARGGAALSMRAVTGQPIKFLGLGEKTDALEVYHPDRLAGRILDMGDVVSLVEKAATLINEEDAAKVAEKAMTGKFDLDDLSSQLQQMRKMGGMSGILGMLPGIGKIKDQLKDANIDDRMIGRQMAIISSMTRAERRNPDLLKASRKVRIAKGAGVDVADVNRLLKQFMDMQKMMKQFQKLGQKGMLRNMTSMMRGKF
jgi:signal recognition particle subunit SRP54